MRAPSGLSGFLQLVTAPPRRRRTVQRGHANPTAPANAVRVGTNGSGTAGLAAWAPDRLAPTRVTGDLDNKLKICFLAYQGNMFTGGQGVYLYYLTRELARMGHEVHVIAGVPYPELADEVHLHRVKPFSHTSRLDAKAEYDDKTYPFLCFNPINFYELITTRYSLTSLLNMFSLRAYHKLNELELDGAFDLIHDNQTLAYGTWMMKLRQTPVVGTIHHPLAADRETSVTRAHSLRERIGRIVWYPWVMQRWVAQRLDSVITVSDASAGALEDAYGIGREQMSIIPNGVDHDMFRPVEVAKEPGRILFVGRTEDEQKGFVYLLQALKKLRGEAPFHLTVVTRPARERTERLVDQMGLYGRVTFLENVSTEELVGEYNKAQFVVSPSLCEGFGLPAIESLACGTPVIATTVGAFPDIIESGVSGLLVPPADACALSHAIQALLENPQRCRDMGAVGRQHVIERFSWDRAAKETVQVYREAIARTAAAR